MGGRNDVSKMFEMKPAIPGRMPNSYCSDWSCTNRTLLISYMDNLHS